MLGHFFAAEPARDRTNGRTYDGAYRPGSERSGRRTGSDGTCGCSKSDATCGCSKAYSNRMRTWAPVIGSRFVPGSFVLSFSIRSVPTFIRRDSVGWLKFQCVHRG
jgi:hypothetical protein